MIPAEDSTLVALSSSLRSDKWRMPATTPCISFMADRNRALDSIVSLVAARAS